LSSQPSPKQAAIQLVKLWQAAMGITFPIKVPALAEEWSRQVAPDERIGEIKAANLDGFEGGLFLLPERKVWALLYRKHEDLPGRTNFTIAHEFGHYVLHRKLQNIFQCTQSATLGLEAKRIEQEADQFASYLLMPIDDFRIQIRGTLVTLDILNHCATRYEVSLTAAALKWVEFTHEAIVLVFAREGMVHWWRPSDSARRLVNSKLYPGMEVPLASPAASQSPAFSSKDLRDGIFHSEGVWFKNIAVREMVVLSDRYDMSISLLVLDPPVIDFEEDDAQDLTTIQPKL
jgi:hypothetical protein